MSSEQIKPPFNNDQAAEQLGTASSSLRKWCLALEQHGFNMEKLDTNKRLFFPDDLIVLRNFQYMVTTKNMSFKNAAAIVTNRFSKRDGKVFFDGKPLEQANTMLFMNESVDEQLTNNSVLPATPYTGDEFQIMWRTQEEHFKRQEEFNRFLVKKLDEQQSFIVETLSSLENRQKERENILVESLKESMEYRKQLAATFLEEDQNKKRWYEFWK